MRRRARAIIIIMSEPTDQDRLVWEPTPNEEEVPIASLAHDFIRDFRELQFGPLREPPRIESIIVF
jgi:hypothetical protein